MILTDWPHYADAAPANLGHHIAVPNAQGPVRSSRCPMP